MRLNGSWLGSRVPALTDAGTWKASTPPLNLRAACACLSWSAEGGCEELPLAICGGQSRSEGVLIDHVEHVVVNDDAIGLRYGRLVGVKCAFSTRCVVGRENGTDVLACAPLCSAARVFAV